jgi:thymidylate synthase (FAD)
MTSVDLYGDGIGKVELVDAVGSDLTIVNSARVSFGVHKSELDDKDRKLIRYLIKHKHTSTLEHCFVTFRVKVPLFIRSQHHRHRTWSYNEISRRYTAEKLEFYEPKVFAMQHDSNRQASDRNNLIDPKVSIPYLVDENGFASTYAEALSSDAVKNHHALSVKLYEQLMEKGVCREQARGVLPQNLYTEYYASANLNNILKFIELRSHEGAQWEIQKVAEAMLQILEGLYPETLKAYNEVRHAD